MGLASLRCKKRIDDIRTRERKRKRRFKELEGLVPLVEEKRTWLGGLAADASDRLHHYLFSNYRITWRRMSRGAYLISRYSDHHGEVVQLFRSLQIAEEDQLSWLEFWEELDENDDNKMEYSEFMEAFGLRDDMYSRRFYDMINTSLTGFLTFKEFISNTWAYLVNDQQETLKLSFRLMSRLGTDFKPDKSVLDLTDFSNFLEFRYPGMDERSRSRRARALFGFVAGSRGRDVTGIDYETWCSYCFQDEPLLLTYTCALQQVMRRRLFGEPYWMGLTKARSPPYVYDLVLERRIKTLVKQEADRAKDGRPADFNADFPTIAKRFKNDRVLKTMALAQKKAVSWQAATATRERVIRLLENLEEGRRPLWDAFNRWRRNVGMGRIRMARSAELGDSQQVDEKRQSQSTEKPAEAQGSGSQWTSSVLSFFGMGGKKKQQQQQQQQDNKAEAGKAKGNSTSTAKTAAASSTDSRPRSPSLSPRGLSPRGARLSVDSVDSPGRAGTARGFDVFRVSGMMDDTGGSNDTERDFMSTGGSSSRFFDNNSNAAKRDNIYKKILEREEGSQLSEKDLLNEYIGDWKKDVHHQSNGSKPLMTAKEIEWRKDLMRQS